MKFAVNVLNFGPGANPRSLRDWAEFAESAGYHAVMISDHIAVTPDIAARYPEPFYDGFTVLAWLAGITSRVELGTTVTVLPYRHPLQVARIGSDIDQLSHGRFILGAGLGWAKQEFQALGIPYECYNYHRHTDPEILALAARRASEVVGPPQRHDVVGAQAHLLP